MDFDIVGLILRWMHILAAITAVGGTIFMRTSLLPAVGVLAEDQRRALHEAIRSRWSKMIAGSILFLLVSGLINFILIIRAAKSWPDELPGYYHPVFGVKFLLALGIFFIASALAGRSSGTQKMRDNLKFWMNVNLTLAVTVVLLSGVLRMTHIGPNLTEETRQPSRELVE